MNLKVMQSWVLKKQIGLLEIAFLPLTTAEVHLFGWRTELQKPINPNYPYGCNSIPHGSINATATALQ